MTGSSSIVSDWKSEVDRLAAILSPYDAGVAQWQSPSLPSWSRGFDSRRPLCLLNISFG